MKLDGILSQILQLALLHLGLIWCQQNGSLLQSWLPGGGFEPLPWLMRLTWCWLVLSAQYFRVMLVSGFSRCLGCFVVELL
jgi:hypothetical protein